MQDYFDDDVIANLVAKTDFDAKLSSFNKKITESKTKYLLVQNQSNKLKTFDSSYFIGKDYVKEDGAQNYLVFQPIIRYFKVNAIINVTDYILSRRSKGLSAETIKPPTTSDNSFTQTISYYYAAKTRAIFTGSCWKQSKTSYNHRKIVNIYIVFELGASGSNNSDPTIKNSSFGTVTLTKNADIDKYGYFGYEIGFDRKSTFSFPGGV